MNSTAFSLVYDSFFSKITDDMYLELNELDTYRMLEQLLLSAIQKFEFPRVNLNDYELTQLSDVTRYKGVESNNEWVDAFIYEGGYFNIKLTHQEINILAVYMIVEWLSQQLASVENTRMKYSGSDFKFTSQANHMQKLLQMKKDYEREGFHLQRLYKRRKSDKNGIMRSTFGQIMQPININFREVSNDSSEDEEEVAKVIDYRDLINKPKIESHELIDDKTFEDLGLRETTSDEIITILQD